MKLLLSAIRWLAARRRTSSMPMRNVVLTLIASWLGSEALIRDGMSEPLILGARPSVDAQPTEASQQLVVESLSAPFDSRSLKRLPQVGSNSRTLKLIPSKPIPGEGWRIVKGRRSPDIRRLAQAPEVDELSTETSEDDAHDLLVDKFEGRPPTNPISNADSGDASIGSPLARPSVNHNSFSQAESHRPLVEINALPDPSFPASLSPGQADVKTIVGTDAREVPFDPTVFAPDPDYSGFAPIAEVEHGAWAGKYLNPTERPWVELGRGLYLPGRMPTSQTFFGEHNLTAQHLLVYGDYRTAVAYVDAGARDRWTWAHRLNLEVDWKLTATERIHAFTGPIDNGGQFTRLDLNNESLDAVDEFDRNWDTVYFEGDVGALLGGWLGHDSEFDMPFAVGLMPLLFQNGIWMEDAFVGAAVTLPARHSAALGWSNFDVTFFAGIDELNSPAFPGDDSAAHVYGVIGFVEAYDGYVETGYAFLDDTSGQGLSYHNLGVSYTRRYLHRLSNSIRVLLNSGQQPLRGPRTADGALFLLESSLITSCPNTFVPYLNLFAGYGRPQSVSRAAVAGGVLRNTGILFETDGLTGFPFLDDTASNSYGGAIGVNWLGPDFSYQVIVEAAMLQTFGRAGGRRAVDDQFGLGMRYQLPLTHAWILRMDALYGFFENADDIGGGRVEMRYKF